MAGKKVGYLVATKAVMTAVTMAARKAVTMAVRMVGWMAEYWVE